MSRRRRIVAALFAALAYLLLGLGTSSTALACPVTLAASAGTSQSAPDDCDHSALGSCVTACSTMCQGMVAAAAGPASSNNEPFTQFWRAVESITADRSGPDPPPPRMG